MFTIKGKTAYKRTFVAFDATSRRRCAPLIREAVFRSRDLTVRAQKKIDLEFPIELTPILREFPGLITNGSRGKPLWMFRLREELLFVSPPQFHGSVSRLLASVVPGVTWVDISKMRSNINYIEAIDEVSVCHYPIDNRDLTLWQATDLISTTRGRQPLSLTVKFCGRQITGELDFWDGANKHKALLGLCGNSAHIPLPIKPENFHQMRFASRGDIFDNFYVLNPDLLRQISP
ncbi:MAG: hypothetical protein KKB81_05970 [Candidatus Margulisbacteria bacterium]|nr:hypothetical protein [Candidatus Margulisiibacteriota bacterium]MBU1021407.1 hypothetical protein [Candidatus Margulisiibacteriota bacterium]MBU1728328.1 hypothetical protein [Candidatus Margulisiibacteriota bacterium]MBU1955929.1 hypothetical protein [Candidatus Margulisiibacteriota bacterium]